MFDLSHIKTRYWTIRFPDGLTLDVESPKLKVLRELSEIAGINAVNEKTIGILTCALAKALSKNKQGTVVTDEYIGENLNIDEMIALLTSYFNWVAETKNDPN
ncbi:MAG: hypothetical protein DBY45_08030 [Clostridiales bacterium]|nr:MAG: hypothetical protein DBY45_08030 [Clostridiales bacterium]